MKSQPTPPQLNKTMIAVANLDGQGLVLFRSASFEVIGAVRDAIREQMIPATVENGQTFQLHFSDSDCFEVKFSQTKRELFAVAIFTYL